MYILGLHNDEDSGICLLKDGELIDAVSEERFNREKLYKGLPKLSLQYVLKKHNLKLDDINYFANGWQGGEKDCTKYALKIGRRILKAISNNEKAGKFIEDRLQVEYERDTNTIKEFMVWTKELCIPKEKIYYLDHHQSHAWSAFATSPYDEAVVFTFDGRGDLKSASVSIANKKDGVTELDYLLTFDSIGFLYGKITKYLGYKPHRHEGKVTGLAAYGDPEKTLPIFNKLISWNGDTITANLGYYKPFYSVRRELKRELDKYSREDIAAGLQRHTEDLVVRYVEHWLKKLNRSNCQNVCLAGGVFANVKLNQRIAEIDGIDNVFIFPHMGDGGLPVGSACFLNYKLTGNSKVDMPTVYLGNNYSNDEVLETLKRYSARVTYERLEDRVEQTVEELIDEKVVGYFSKRMEYGPRALGARSILYHTRDKSVNDWLNKRLQRTEFMPFAPVTPVEYAADCYKNWSPKDKCSDFMTITYDCTEEFKKVHKAVVHVDGTARPQTVTEELNGDYYRIVKRYCEKSGEKALINTSFNQHEEPIVCTPEDSIESLLKDNVDVLIIGEYKIIKKIIHGKR